MTTAILPPRSNPGRGVSTWSDTTKRLTATEEVELGRRVRAGDQAARERFIRANQGLVVHVADRFQGLGLGLDDMVSEGNLGLIEAVDRFDPERGIRFSTYATHWIKMAIRRAFGDQAHAVKLGCHVTKAVGKWRRTEADLSMTLGRPATEAEVADALGLSLARRRTMRLMLASVRPSTSLSGDDDSGFRLDVEDHRTGPTDDVEFVAAPSARPLSLQATHAARPEGDDDEDVERRVEGLGRARLTRVQRLSLVRRYADILAKKHPELVGRKASAKATNNAKRRKAGRQVRGGPSSIPALVGAAFGFSTSAARREIRIAHAFTDDQLACLTEAGVNTNDLDRLAWITDDARRFAAAHLMASGVGVKEAIAREAE